MNAQNIEAIKDICLLLYKHMNPVLDIKENADLYVPLYCYTATTTYALGLTKQERQEVIQKLHKLFDFFYELTIENGGKYHSEWDKYAKKNPSTARLSSAMSHRDKVSSFTEGNTFVCIGSPDGYYFEDSVPGLEFGEITYVLYGMHSFLKELADYEQIISGDIQTAFDLYESIISNPCNRRLYLRMRLKKSDIVYLSDAINEGNRANEESINKRIEFLRNVYYPSRNPYNCTAAVCSVMLNSDFLFAKPLGDCQYKLCDGIEEIKDIVFEREMATAFLKLYSVLNIG